MPSDRAPTRRPGLRGAFLRVLLLAVVFALAAATGACSDDGGDPAAGEGAGGVDRSTTSADSDGTDGAEGAEPAEAPFAVGRRDFTLVDESRGTDAVPSAGVATAPDRTIELTVIYPAEGEPGDVPVIPDEWTETGDPEGRSAIVGAGPAAGPFPVVLWAHGWMGQGASFLPQAERWAREGYVVALPTFPLSKAPIGFSDDYVNQPDDLAFVLDHLMGLAGDDPLAGLVDGDDVAIGGHSLGGATVFRGGYNACCALDDVDAVIAASGGPLDIGEPGYQDQPATPMMLVHGAADPGVPVTVSDAMVDFITAPVTYLRLDDADHTSLFVGDDGELFNEAALAFLDATLFDDTEDLDDLQATVDASGLGELRTG